MFLIPFTLDVDYRRRPWALFALLVAMAAGTWLAPRLDERLFHLLAFDPNDVRPWQFATSLFLHADLWHFLGNALFLWLFGRLVEDRLGPVRFLVLFFAFGAFASATHLGFESELPSIGASGAIAGMMGLVLFTAPRANVRAVLFVYWRVFIRRFPAWVMLGIWLAVNLVGAVLGGGDVDYVAHLGGFLAGCLTSWLLRSPLFRNSGWRLAVLPAGGDPAPPDDVLRRSEVMWRTLDVHLRRSAPVDHAGKQVFDITPAEQKPRTPPS